MRLEHSSHQVVQPTACPSASNPFPVFQNTLVKTVALSYSHRQLQPASPSIQQLHKVPREMATTCLYWGYTHNSSLRRCLFQIQVWEVLIPSSGSALKHNDLQRALERFLNQLYCQIAPPVPFGSIHLNLKASESIVL